MFFGVNRTGGMIFYSSTSPPNLLCNPIINIFKNTVALQSVTMYTHTEF